MARHPSPVPSGQDLQEFTFLIVTRKLQQKTLLRLRDLETVNETSHNKY
jgi:hypothetical protein